MSRRSCGIMRRLPAPPVVALGERMTANLLVVAESTTQPDCWACTAWHVLTDRRGRVPCKKMEHGGAQGKEAAAESEWNFACDRISVGCTFYKDRDWLSRIRRQGPSLVTDKLAPAVLASAHSCACRIFREQFTQN